MCSVTRQYILKRYQGSDNLQDLLPDRIENTVKDVLGNFWYKETSYVSKMI